MEQSKIAKALILFAFMGFSISQVRAQSINQESYNTEWSNSSWYFGAGAGQSRSTFDQPRLINSLIANGANSVVFTKDEKDLAYQLYLGKQLTENFALEGGYFNLGQSSFSAIGSPGRLDGKVEFQGLNLDLLGRANLTERFSFIANIGMHYAEAKGHFGGDRLLAVTNPNTNERKLNGKYGLGLEYQLTPAFAVRGQVQRYRVSDSVRNRGDIDTYSVSLVYRVGQVVQRQTIASPVPADVTKYIPEPKVLTEVEPVPVGRTPIPVSEKKTFSAEALFDFDSSVVKVDGKLAFDQLIASLQNMDTEVMVTVGHTDSVGSDSYNLGLSSRRAESVKAYLVSRGISTNRIYTEGKGERQPIADNATSEGRTRNRRVIVEVIGSRR